MTNPWIAGGPQPLAGEDFWPITFTRYYWNEEPPGSGFTYCETITYFDTTTRLVTRVTLQNTSTVHTGIYSVTDNKGRIVTSGNIPAPKPLQQWNIGNLKINVDTDNYEIGLSMT